ncbi:pyridoxamine 5'-phosphate oxidase family protein [Nonomuraea aridisoli]|uniref:Pyridoxamine 5'-phosphate oxidase n=1 Tax=Nonomuraea aridisoli TaxID=2070368 RepID=A0A2W2E5M1_9ACTN|nr:pyridoxamine 5'-phosphate oxidase family protein [Nonomuraea aridisoli]PZG12515.1 pyridoxamine 5'-phosphate oxidase [Nonomuraea aridisoli]
MTYDIDARPRALTELSREESLRLLGNVGLGRIVFISRAMPAIRLVSHVMTDGHIVVRTGYEPEIEAVLRPRGTSMVVYQADMVDPATHLGWNVMVTGTAALVPDAGGPQSWTGEKTALVLRIRPEHVTGFEVTGDPS